MTYDEELNHGAYSGGEKCEYTGTWYNGRCSCSSHRRDRQYYSKNNNDIREVFHKIARSDSYEILQIEPPAEYEKVKRAYHKMSLKSHPDKQGGSNELFIKVKDAYDDLLLLC